ncbi:hypothetical protein P4O66_021569 [Electrophorus voltai]|uniref:Protein LTV1 homolog n=1 Tax=Electrophorus voltai TaxID=2609070 RepID=A0AAD8ZRP2_9TELE|nr:hypothetical protein P4O66_021569 [Electrophorus voltai]
MPHRKKKAFIRKKNAVSFHLVHRSQKDPLAADEKAPQYVLLPAVQVEVEKRKEEQRKYGVFFDDNYDYLQHLRETSQAAELVSASRPHRDARPLTSEEEDYDGEEEVLAIPGASIKLPSSVFASEFEEEVGLLNKAAPVSGPRLDMDPDIVAALDEDFDFDDPENFLEDDFVIKANDILSGDGNVGDEGGDEEEWESTDEGQSAEEEERNYGSAGGLLEDDGDGEEEGGRRRFAFMECETRSRFTDYSLTSSVMRRNEQLTLLDDRFEKFYEQFDDDEIGALDNAEVEGFIDPDSMRLAEVIQDYFKQKDREFQKPQQLGPSELPSLKEEEDGEDEEQDMETLVIEEQSAEKWDCETIISTYSNLYNHPKLIKDPPKQQPKRILVSSKTGIPLDVLPKKGLTARQAERMERIDASDLPRVSTQLRSRQESTEERKHRKQAIKDERKERRAEKKSNKLAFKQEKQTQEKQMLSLRTHVQGLKLS